MVIMRGAWLFCAAVGITVLLLNQSFIALWVGTGHFAGNVENLLIMLITVQVIFFQIDSYIINATLDMRKKVLLSAGAAVVSILLAMFLVSRFLIIGLCISMLIGRLFYTLGFAVLLKRQIKDSTPPWSIPHLKSMLMTFCFFAIATYVGQFIFLTSWLSFLTAGIFTLLIGFLLYWRLGLNLSERRETRALLEGIKFFKMK
jgi:hypothetical protein